MQRHLLIGLVSAVGACLLLPSLYTVFALAGAAPMTGPIFLAWLAWLQVVHAIVGAMLWRRREQLPSRLRAIVISWAGLAIWYWLAAPVYFLLTMNVDALQLAWTAFAFFWEVPVVGGAFLLVTQRFYPSRRRLASVADGARQYRLVLRYPTLVAGLLFVFTFAGYVVGTLQLRAFAAFPFVEQMKNLAHGLVISLLLAVFYHLALDRVLEPVRARIAREYRLGTVVARTLAGRILAVSLVVAVSGFALISLFVMQAFQGTVRETAQAMLQQDLAWLAAARDDRPASAKSLPGWGERGLLLVLSDGETLPEAEFSPETQRAVAAARVGIVHDTRADLKLVGFLDVPSAGGKLVGVTFLTDSYGPLWNAARLLGAAGACVLVVMVGMLVFATRASTQALRALSSAVRRVEAGEADESTLRLDTADEIGELSAAVARYAQQSRDLRENLEEKVRDKTRRLAALHDIDRDILAAESAEAIARAALPRLRSILASDWAAIVAIEPAYGRARFAVVDGQGPDEGTVIPIAELPSLDVLRTKGVRYFEDLRQPEPGWSLLQRLVRARTQSVIAAPLGAGAETIGLLCVGSRQARAFGNDHVETVHEVANQIAVAIRQSRLREALDQEQRRLQAVVEHLPEGVLLLDGRGRIALANPFARAHMSALVEISRDGDVVAVGGIPLSRLLARPETAPFEVTVTTPVTGVFQIAARRFDGTASERACVLVVRDVSRERDAQKSAQQQARLAAVGQLAAGIAHDFNNILMTIINSAELAHRRREQVDFVAARLDTIAEQGERAAALVRQILDFSRQTAPKLRPVDFAMLVRQTVELLDRTLPETIRIVADVPEGSSDRFAISADPNQLSQVLTNLGVNARDAMPLGGELVYGLRRARREGPDVPDDERGDWVVLTVRDTGTGMPAEGRERIFEPFYTTKAPGRGTGLGLSQAYGIVQQHHGHIGVESEPGNGTTFTIRLPALASMVPVSDPRTAGAPVKGNGETLLVVEDEPGVRKVLSDMLGHLNYRVLVASSAEEAIDLHARHSDEAQLVLTDLVMPGVGGVGLMRILKARAPGLPVIMMSGYVGDGVRDRLDGVAAWVQKPANARGLGKVIREALGAR